MIPSPFPTDRVAGSQFFTMSDNTANRSIQAWSKPQGCSFIFFFLLNGGGGGGGGRTGAAGTARGGGGGGGSSAAVRFLIPAFFLPDTLYLFVGRGGNGGAANGAGTSGTNSIILTGPENNTKYMIFNGGTAAGGGAAGTASAGGTGGTAGAVGVGGPFASSGLFFAQVGVGGATGGAHTGAIGSAVTPPTALPVTGGAGGGGTPTGNTNFAGGAINAVGQWPLISGGLAAGGAGNHGFEPSLRLDSMNRRLEPFITSGGSGGGTNGAAGVGGAGGEAGLGSGGGGGGGGVTGGAGGKGGDGCILVAWW